jgi:hypothetical protein
LSTVSAVKAAAGRLGGARLTEGANDLWSFGWTRIDLRTSAQARHFSVLAPPKGGYSRGEIFDFFC